VKCLFCKLFNYEYWPWFVWHTLALPIHIYNSIRCKSITYFTALNPSFGKSGGFVGDFKSEINKHLPQTYRLKENVVSDMKSFAKAMMDFNLDFPVVLKPEAGERGEGVQIIDTQKEAEVYLNRKHKYPILIQEFANFKNEYGIFVYNHPHRGWQVSGVNTKIPFDIVGDGKSNLLELVSAKCRYRQQLERLAKLENFNLKEILPKGTIKRIDNVQNHRYGAEFVNCSHLVNDRFASVILGISAQIPGFNYGRFDVKANSFEDIENHRFKIMELNGAAAEQTIIYDQKNTGFINSLKIVFNHLAVQGEIARNNINKGHQPLPLKSFRTVMRTHFNNN